MRLGRSYLECPRVFVPSIPRPHSLLCMDCLQHSKLIVGWVGAAYKKYRPRFMCQFVKSENGITQRDWMRKFALELPIASRAHFHAISGTWTQKHIIKKTTRVGECLQRVTPFNSVATSRFFGLNVQMAK